ncbi:unnamed protein product, partial [Closterium sp. NIES-64]
CGLICGASQHCAILSGLQQCISDDGSEVQSDGTCNTNLQLRPGHAIPVVEPTCTVTPLMEGPLVFVTRLMRMTGRILEPVL